MRIAFYAPMKPPGHATPSGDARIARLLLAALRRAGHRTVVASRLRSWDGVGDPRRQRLLAEQGRRTAERLVARYEADAASRPDLWFTYHLYHKAPDWIGPAVARRLDIPYAVAEASFAPKRAGGPWTPGHEAVAAALRGADAVFHLNRRDAEMVEPLLKPSALSVVLPPFLDTGPFAAAPSARLGLAGGPPVLLAVGMMRPGDKLASYRALADALGRLGTRSWQLVIVGDGPARPEVEAAFAPFGGRVRFLGAQPPADLPAIYHAADLFVWPAVNEAFGMAILEAQAAGLPVVAGRVGGVPGIVADGETGLLVAPDDRDAFAAAVARLLDDGETRAALGMAARRKVARDHDLPSAARTLDAALRALAGEGR